MCIYIALQPYGGVIVICLYKYLSITKLFLNRNFLQKQSYLTVVKMECKIGNDKAVHVFVV